MARIVGPTVFAVVVLASGCAGFYTNIEKSADGSYTITKVAQGFWRVRGEVYRCEGAGTAMTCRKIASE
jgi:hypothetical protein